MEPAGFWRTFVLEDLDEAGFRVRKQDLEADALVHCLSWLASFHATFLGVAPEGLWPTGTYWHLDTRPDELAVIQSVELREAAAQIDAILGACRTPTLVHGDAKSANFCFADDGTSVAAVDFQYVGGGCGIKDVAYLLSSCLHPVECEIYAERALDSYFVFLRRALRGRDVDVDAVEEEWRYLYPFAWADFTRFLAGWAPEHWKLHEYSLALTHEVLASL